MGGEAKAAFSTAIRHVDLPASQVVDLLEPPVEDWVRTRYEIGGA